VEELVPVAFSVYDRDSSALAEEQTHALLHARPEPRRKPDDEVSEGLADALGRPDLDALLREAVEARRRALVADRQALLARDTAHEGREQLHWLAGIADLKTASYDVLTATLYYPALG
jgi:hypothetical protein